MKKYEITPEKIEYDGNFKYNGKNSDTKEMAEDLKNYFENFSTTNSLIFESESGLFSYRECENITKSFNKICEVQTWGEILSDNLKPRLNTESNNGYEYIDENKSIEIAVIDQNNYDMIHEAFMGIFINNTRKYISNFSYTFYFIEGFEPKFENGILKFNEGTEKVYYIFREYKPNKIKLSKFLKEIDSADADKYGNSIIFQYESCMNLMNFLYKGFLLGSNLDTLYVTKLDENIDIPYYEQSEEEESNWIFWTTKKSIKNADKFINTNIVLDIVDFKNSLITVDTKIGENKIDNYDDKNNLYSDKLILEELKVELNPELVLSDERKSNVLFCNSELANYTCNRIYYPCNFVDDENLCIDNNVKSIIENYQPNYKSFKKTLFLTKNIINKVKINYKNYFKICKLLNFLYNELQNFPENAKLKKKFEMIEKLFTSLFKKVEKKEQDKIKCKIIIYKELFLIQRYVAVYSYFFGDTSLLDSIGNFLKNEDNIDDVKISVNKSGNPFVLVDDPISVEYSEYNIIFLSYILSGVHNYISFEQFLDDNIEYLIGLISVNTKETENLGNFPKGKLFYIEDLIYGVNPSDVSELVYKIFKYNSLDENLAPELDETSLILNIREIEL